VKELHPFETPAFLVLPVEGGDADYLEWLMQETKPATSS
jgi:periplasmic divalent cation tolerance protein